MKEHLTAYFDSVKIYIIIQIVAIIIPFIVGAISEFCTNAKIKKFFKIILLPVELLSAFTFGYCSGVSTVFNPVALGVIFVIVFSIAYIIAYIIFIRKIKNKR